MSSEIDLRGAGSCRTPGFPLSSTVAWSDGVRMQDYPRGTGTLDYLCEVGTVGSR